MSYFWAEQNVLFSVAIAIVIILAIVEGLLTVIGLGLSAFLDGLAVDADADVDIVADLNGADLDGTSSLGAILAWLRVGEVPMVVLLVIFLSAFGALGFALQGIVHELTGRYLLSYVAAIPATFGALPAMRFFGGLIAKVIPKEETSAVSSQTLIGRIATITLGSASSGHPAQAKVRDEHGLTHYVMVEPDEQERIFEQGSNVLLVSKQGSVFHAIANEHESLTPDA